MAAGKESDFKIYHSEFYGGMYERLVQVTQAFNIASNGGVQLITKKVLGDYQKESFLKRVSNLITRRDLTVLTAADDLPMTMDELISVKINRKIGPAAQTLDAWKKVGADPAEFSFKLGQIIAEEKLKDMLNTGILCIEAAIQGQAALVYDATGESTKTLTHTHLVSGLAKMGDRAVDILVWVMHSKPYFDLLKQALADKIFEVAGAVVYSGTVATFNRPTVVIDAPALHDANGSATDTYNVLGLTASGVVVQESEEETITSQMVTGLEQLVMRIQGEYAFNVGCKGFKWDVTNGGANPTDTALGTTTNWDKAMAEDKNLAGVRVLVQ